MHIKVQNTYDTFLLAKTNHDNYRVTNTTTEPNPAASSSSPTELKRSRSSSSCASAGRLPELLRAGLARTSNPGPGKHPGPQFLVDFRYLKVFL